MRVPFPTIWLTMIRFVIVILLDFFPFNYVFGFDDRNKNVMNHKHTYAASNEVNSRRASIAQFMRFPSFNVTNKFFRNTELYTKRCFYTHVSIEHWACVGVCACTFMKPHYIQRTNVCVAQCLCCLWDIQRDSRHLVVFFSILHGQSSLNLTCISTDFR